MYGEHEVGCDATASVETRRSSVVSKGAGTACLGMNALIYRFSVQIS
jgi:hypothetical protein